MFQKFMEYMKDYREENASEDYWYDYANLRVRETIEQFTITDWKKLLSILDEESNNFKRKLAYCLEDASNPFEFCTLIMLIDTQDDALLISCLDSLRSFASNETYKPHIKRLAIVAAKTKGLSSDSNDVESIVLNDLAKKLE